MTLKEAKFVSTVNWVTHKLGEDLKYDEIKDFKQRLIDIQKQLDKALEEYITKETS